MENLHNRVTKLEVWATGINGENGINSRIRQLEKEVKSLQKQMWIAAGFLTGAQVILKIFFS